MSVQVSYSKQFTLGIFFLIILFAALEGSARTYEIFNPDCTFLEKDAFEKVGEATETALTVLVEKLNCTGIDTTVSINTSGIVTASQFIVGAGGTDLLSELGSKTSIGLAIALG